MALAGIGYDMKALFDELLRRGSDFSFNQAMRILRHLRAAEACTAGDGGFGEISVRPHLSLAFPASDVVGVEGSADRLVVTATFLGLYGASSPLPTHYTEELFAEAAADSSLTRDFLDILHRRLYRVYLECWNKYRLFLKVQEERNPQDVERLLCLAGIGAQGTSRYQSDAMPLLRYAGLLGQPRSALGLQTLLRDALDAPRLEVLECVARRVRFPEDQQTSLGVANLSLGRDAIVGDEMCDLSGKFRIRIGPLGKPDYDSFIPGGDRYQSLARLAERYLCDPLEYDLELVLAAGEAAPLRLGVANAPRLGLNSWCFSGETFGELAGTYPSASLPPPPDEEERDPLPQAAKLNGIGEYYQDELRRLRELASSYAKANPAVAALVTGNLADPSVERLLEGAAFLNAQLRQKLDDDYPEIVDELCEALHPWSMRPVPATTMVAFTPKKNLSKPLVIGRGSEVASIPVEGTRCRFRTCFEVKLHPIELLDAAFAHPSGKAPSITLRFALTGAPLADWNTDRIRFFLGDEYAAACDIYLLLTRYLRRVVISSGEKGASVELPADRLVPVGWANEESLLPAPESTPRGHLIVQEYFLFKDKFLFLDLCGLDACGTLARGSEFAVLFELLKNPLPEPELTRKSFVLFATPAVNIFRHEARPVEFTFASLPQKLEPEASNRDHYRIYAVDRVTGVETGAFERREFTRDGIGSEGERPGCRYSVSRTTGSGAPAGLEIDLCGPGRPRSGKQKLKIELTCTNGHLPEKLGAGDICVPTSSIPEAATFRDITPINPPFHPSTTNNRQWRLLASLLPSRAPLETAAGLRAALRLFVPDRGRNLAAIASDHLRIEGIEAVDATPTDRLVDGSIRRGYGIEITVNEDHFAGPGDMHLFCDIIHRFLCDFVTHNCTIRTKVKPSKQRGKKEERQWSFPAKEYR